MVISHVIAHRLLLLTLFSQIIARLENRREWLEQELESRDAELMKREHELTQYKDTIRHYVLEDEEKAMHIDELEEQLSEIPLLQKVRLQNSTFSQ